MPKISVIVPTYRRPQWLGICLKALLGQKRRPDEIIVVIRSTDQESAAVVERLLADGAMCLRTVRVSEVGHEPALNAGLSAATGDIICFTDDDAEPFPDWTARIEARLTEQGVGGVGGRVFNYVDGKLTLGRTYAVGFITWYGKVLGRFEYDYLGESPVEVQVLRGNNMAFRRDFLDGIRFDERLDRRGSWGCEIGICYHVRRRGGHLLYDPAIRVNHHWAPRMWWASREDDAAAVYNYSHNLTYVMLKHLGVRGWLVFLPYFLLVGQSSSLGPLAILYEIKVRRSLPNWRTKIVPSYQGKIAGIRTYLRHWREARSA